MVFKSLMGLFSKDMAMDLGTANTLIYIKGAGVVLNEPSAVAVRRDTGKLLAVGAEARRYLGRTHPDVLAARPLKDGVIADFDLARIMIKEFVSRARASKGLVKPRMLIGVPSGVTQVEKRAVIESAQQAGAREVHLIEEPMAAAIGAGLPIEGPTGSMVVDIGGGTTEVAVISLYTTAYSESVRVAGDEANEAVLRYVQKKFQLQIGETTAEDIKIKLGSAYPGTESRSMEIYGKDLLTGTPGTATITDKEVREAMAEPVEVIIESIQRAFEKTPPELAADVAQVGLTLTGGGALIKGLDQLIRDVMNIKVNIADNPLNSVVMGAGLALQNAKEYRRVYIN